MAAGVPLGVLLVSGPLISLIYERRLRFKAKKTIVDTLEVRDTSHMGWIGEGNHRWKRHLSPREVENTQVKHRESYDGKVYGVDGPS